MVNTAVARQRAPGGHGGETTLRPVSPAQPAQQSHHSPSFSIKPPACPHVVPPTAPSFSENVLPWAASYPPPSPFPCRNLQSASSALFWASFHHHSHLPAQPHRFLALEPHPPGAPGCLSRFSFLPSSFIFSSSSLFLPPLSLLRPVAFQLGDRQCQTSQRVLFALCSEPPPGAPLLLPLLLGGTGTCCGPAAPGQREPPQGSLWVCPVHSCVEQWPQLGAQAVL